MRFFKWLLLLGILPTVAACSSTFEWKEEVQLSDGRVIVVTQKRRYEYVYDGSAYGDIPREAWLTFSLPETGGKEILWNEKLEPMILNLHQGKVYVVGWPPSGREFDLYGQPRPPYICYQLQANGWKRIPLEQLPKEIYDTNLVIDGSAKKIQGLLSITQKNSKQMNGNISFGKERKRVDPAYQTNF